MRNPFDSHLINSWEDIALLDRELDLDDLDAVCNGPVVMNSRYISPRGTGKSTLLEHYFSDEQCKILATQHKLVRICHFSGEEMQTDAAVFVRLIAAVKETFENLDSDMYERLSNMVLAEEKKYPTYFTDANSGEALLRVVLSRLKREGYRVTLILDEFHQLACSNRLAETTFSKMASLSQSGLISYIIASDYDDNVGTESFYISHFTRIFIKAPTHLGGITSKTGQATLKKLLSKKLAPCGEDISFTDRELQTIIRITGGIPELIRLTLKNLFDVKLRDPEELSEERLTEYSLFACRHHMDKWVQYFDDTKWKTLGAILEGLTEEEIRDKLMLDAKDTTIRDLAVGGLIIDNPMEMTYDLICPLFSMYVRRELARKQHSCPVPELLSMTPDPLSDNLVQPYVIKNEYYFDRGTTFVQNSGSGNAQIIQDNRRQGFGISDVLSLLQQHASSTFREFAKALSDHFKSRLSSSTRLQLPRTVSCDDPDYDVTYDEAFDEYSQKIVPDLTPGDEQSTAIPAKEVQTLDMRFNEIRGKYNATLTDELLDALSERCRFYLKLSIIVEDALNIPGLQLEDYSPHLVLYGKVLEQSLRDGFYDLFHNDSLLSVYDTFTKQMDAGSQNVFANKTVSKTFIGSYIHLMRSQQKYLAQLCLNNLGQENYAPNTLGEWEKWWSKLHRDINGARDIRNKADHADEVSPSYKNLHNMSNLLLGTADKVGILSRVTIGRELRSLTLTNH